MPLLDYHVAPKHPRALFVAQGLLWAVVAAVLTMLQLFVIPRFVEIFADFKVRLPAATQAILAVWHFADRTKAWLLLWTLPIVVPVLLSMLVRPDETGRIRRGTRLAINLATILVLSLLIGWILLGLFAPVLTFAENISNAGGKR